MIAAITSALGGVFGYFIGAFALETIEPLVKSMGYWHHYENAKQWFDQWGVWVVFLAGFTPIPYKVFTIAAGAASMAMLPFFLVSLIGRGARFYLVAGLIVWGGEKMEATLRKYIEYIGWVVLGLAFVVYLIARL